MKRFKFIPYFLLSLLTVCLVACSDDNEELQDYLTPTTDSEAYFSQGITFSEAASVQNVSFETGGTWETALSGDDVSSWCRISPTSGKAGKSTIQVTVYKNETYEERSATLAIASGTIKKTIVLKQSAMAKVIPEGWSYSPEKPDADQALTIIYKADKSSELYGYSGNVYAHIGLYDGESWSHVQADWNQNTDKCKMSAGDANTWTLTLSPSVREWFGSGTTSISNVAIVVRSSDGGKQTRPDYFIPVTDNTYKAFEPGDMKTGTMPSGLEYGVNIVDNATVTLVLYDKDSQGNHKDFAHVVGDFNNWTLSNDATSQMYRDEAAGCWWITLTGLDASKEYAFQYYVGNKGEGAIRMADAYTEKILDPDNDQWINGASYTYPDGAKGIVSTFKIQQDTYTWKVSDFKIANPDKLVIYEMLLRDFTTSGNLSGAMEKLDYLQALGVNAVELMPTQEFSGNISWGYNPIFYFAMDKAYGTKTQYKQFIDACHERGMAVILDVVYNQADYEMPFVKMYWDSSAGKPAKNNPWFNVDAPHPYSVFFDFNHESDLTRQFVKRNLQFLLTEYNLDGFRFDLTKGFTSKSSSESTASNYDASRVAILKDYNDAIKAVKPEAYVILEHFCADKEENELAESGMHMWREMNNAYCQTAMGYASESAFSGMYESVPAWVGFMESHDKDRTAYKQLAWPAFDSLKGSANHANRMKQLATNTAFFLTVPGPKMIWQFGEMGYDVCIFANSSGQLTVNYGDESYKTDPKPTHWEYLDNTERKELHDVYAKLLAMRNTHPELFDCTGNFTWKVGVSNWSNGRSLYAESITGKKLVVVGNFTDKSTDVAFPAATGTWTNFLTGKEESVADKVSVPAHSCYIYTNF